MSIYHASPASTCATMCLRDEVDDVIVFVVGSSGLPCPSQPQSQSQPVLKGAMIVDLHAHYAMHVGPRGNPTRAALCGSHDHTAIGTDLDGFIEPVHGLDSPEALPQMKAFIEHRYGPEDAQKICSGNALRVLRAAWGGAH